MLFRPVVGLINMPRLHDLKARHGPQKVFNKKMISESYWEPKKNIPINKVPYRLTKTLSQEALDCWNT